MCKKYRLTHEFMTALRPFVNITTRESKRLNYQTQRTLLRLSFIGQ